MNKIEHLKKCKQFLRKVVNYRRNINRIDSRTKMTENMVHTMKTVPQLLAVIISFDKMLTYISREEIQRDVKELIPSNKEAWKDEFDYLIFTGNVLAGKATKQFELSI